jgi:hypothetical protein
MDDANAPVADVTFQVRDHFYVTGRGALVWGLATGRGGLREGILAKSPVTGERFKVTGVGWCVHAPREGQSQECSHELVFRDLSLADVKAAFPAASVVQLFRE